MDDDVDPDAAWSEHAAESLVSLRSLAAAIEKTVSYGAKRSQTELKCTVARAAQDEFHDMSVPIGAQQSSRVTKRRAPTLHQPGAVLGEVLYYHIPPAIPQEAKQRLDGVKGGDGVADLDNASGAAS